jgi:alpha-galactosidase
MRADRVRHQRARCFLSRRSRLDLTFWALVLVSCASCSCGGGQTQSTTPAALPKQSPPKGWSSWYAFYETVSDDKVRHQADLLVSTGLRDAGYVYVNVDGGWEAYRDAEGNIHPNSNFPDMKALGDYLHSKGLKFGIYSSPGPLTCDNLPGSEGFEQQDANTFASWGVDFLKYDWCSLYAVGPPSEPVYRKMRDALDRTGRQIAMSISEIGDGNVWEWGAQAGGVMWRTDHDLGWIQGWPAMTAFERVQAVAAHVATLSMFSSPGHYNDPDYLLTGIKRYCLGPYTTMSDCPAWFDDPMTIDEERQQLDLWKKMSCPLILSVDIGELSAEEILLLRSY